MRIERKSAWRISRWLKRISTDQWNGAWCDTCSSSRTAKRKIAYIYEDHTLLCFPSEGPRISPWGIYRLHNTIGEKQQYKRPHHPEVLAPTSIKAERNKPEIQQTLSSRTSLQSLHSLNQHASRKLIDSQFQIRSVSWYNSNLMFISSLMIRSPSSWFAWPPPTLSTSPPPPWSAPRLTIAPSSAPTAWAATLPTPPSKDTHTPPLPQLSSESSPPSESPTTPLPLLITPATLTPTTLPQSPSMARPGVSQHPVLPTLHKQEIPRCSDTFVDLIHTNYIIDTLFPILLS